MQLCSKGDDELDKWETALHLCNSQVASPGGKQTIPLKFSDSPGLRTGAVEYEQYQ